MEEEWNKELNIIYQKIMKISVKLTEERTIKLAEMYDNLIKKVKKGRLIKLKVILLT